MEISNNTHFSNDAYLLSQQKNKAEQHISPTEKTDKDQRSSENAAAENKAVRKNKDSIESTEQPSEISPFLPINVTKAQQANKAHAQNNDANYRLTAHNTQLALQAEKAVSSYNSVENSQYGQELVNRIELMV